MMYVYTCTIIEVLCGLALTVQSIRHMEACTARTWLAYPLVWTAIGGAGITIAWGGVAGQVPSDWRIALLMLAMTALTAIDRRRRHG